MSRLDAPGIREVVNAAPQPLIHASGVRLGYGPRVVLDQVDLCIRPGEFWFLLGPNGTGKSTLIKALLGLVRPRTGVIRLHPDLARRERLGFVPQSATFNPNLPTTVREFVLLGMVGIRAGAREQRQRLQSALEKVGLHGAERLSYWSLSEGQRQRIVVARALARNPLLLIMDEPTNGLDVAAEGALLEYLARLNREERLAVVFVSHNLATATRYASHVALFRECRVEPGKAADVLTARRLEDVFGVSPADLPRVGAPLSFVCTLSR